MSINDFESIRTTYNAEQVLRYFKIKPTSSGKILCLSHHETDPSAQVYDNGVFCFGCHRSWDVIDLAKTLLERDGVERTYGEVFRWFAETALPAKSRAVYERAEYLGPVPHEYIDYWASQMTDEKYQELIDQRLITRATAEAYRLGWREDWQAWTIPFWRGLPGESEVETVQFRLLSGKPKYIGLKGHSRGAVQNAHLLQQHQPYVVVLFGSYDAILALQDGVIAVGLNGSMPFRKDEKERVQELFGLQDNIIIVPDNTAAEYTPARQLAEWLDTYKVRYFPPELPPGCDYIDYRKLGFHPDDFRQHVLCLGMDAELIVNVGELLKVGDPYHLARYHALTAARHASVTTVVHEIVRSGPLTFTPKQWYHVEDALKDVQTEDELFTQMDKVSELAYSFLGGW